MSIQFFRPRATGRIKFSAALLSHITNTGVDDVIENVPLKLIFRRVHPRSRSSLLLDTQRMTHRTFCSRCFTSMIRRTRNGRSILEYQIWTAIAEWGNPRSAVLFTLF